MSSNVIDNLRQIAQGHSNVSSLAAQLTPERVFAGVEHTPADVALLAGLPMIVEAMRRETNERDRLQIAIARNAQAITRYRIDLRRSIASVCQLERINEAARAAGMSADLIANHDMSLLTDNLAYYQNLINTQIAERQTSMSSLQALESQDANGQVAESLIVAWREASIMKDLPSVRRISFDRREVDGSTRPGVHVEFYPVVVNDANYSDNHYLLDSLSFFLPFINHPRLLWDDIDTDSYYDEDEDPVLVHPHVDGRGDSTCLGQAAGPLQNAYDQRSYSTAVLLISGWARQINNSDSYTNLCNFPTTELPLGWHPELVSA